MTSGCTRIAAPGDGSRIATGPCLAGCANAQQLVWLVLLSAFHPGSLTHNLLTPRQGRKFPMSFFPNIRLHPIYRRKTDLLRIAQFTMIPTLAKVG